MLYVHTRKSEFCFFHFKIPYLNNKRNWRPHTQYKTSFTNNVCRPLHHLPAMLWHQHWCSTWTLQGEIRIHLSYGCMLWDCAEKQRNCFFVFFLSCFLHTQEVQFLSRRQWHLHTMRSQWCRWRVCIGSVPCGHGIAPSPPGLHRSFKNRLSGS